MIKHFWDEQQNFIHWLPVGFGLGIYLYFTFSLAIIFFILPLIALPIFFTIPLGFIYSFFYFSFFHINQIQEPIEHFKFSGIVKEVESFSNKKRTTLKTNNEKIKKVRLTYPKKFDLKKGDYIKASASLLPFSNPPTKYSFDAKKSAAFKGIYSTGRIKWIYEHRKNNSFDIRDNIRKTIVTNMNDPSASIAKAIVLGEKTSIPDKIREQFAQSGIAHLLAISGLHLMLIAGIIFTIMRFFLCLIPYLSISFNTKKIAAMITIFASFFYMFIAGFGYPSQRATIMISTVMLAIIFDRTALSIRSACLAALFILILSPESLLSASFQLSFAAVLPILVFWEYASKFVFPFKILWGPIFTTIIASLAVMPFTAFIFHYITLQSLIGNILSVPIFTYFVMPFGILSLLHSSFFVYWEKSIAFVIKIAAWISTFPGTNIYIAPPSNNLSFALIVFGGLWLCLWKMKWRYLGFAMIFLGVLIYSPASIPYVFEEKGRGIYAWRDSNTLYTKNLRKGRYFLDEWSKVYNLHLKKLGK